MIRVQIRIVKKFQENNYGWDKRHPWVATSTLPPWHSLTGMILNMAICVRSAAQLCAYLTYTAELPHIRNFRFGTCTCSSDRNRLNTLLASCIGDGRSE